MLPALTRKWWVFLVNGLCAVAFGVMTFVWPGMTLLALVVLYGIYCFADGVMALAASIAAPEGGGRFWWQMLVVAMVSIAVGIAAFVWPAITGAALLFIIAIWAIARGIAEIVTAIQVRRFIRNEWTLMLAGAAAILFGIVLIAKPGTGALAVLWTIGSFAILRGGLFIALAVRLRMVAAAQPAH
jgi:uncharacterized membrane protein HdeD (DUF308 family)